MSAASSDARKRGKKRYAAGHHHHSKRWKGARELEVGMQGILITCNMNERKCTAEAFNLLNEYADELFGPEKLQNDNKGSSSDDEEAEEEDVDEALKKEVAQLKASGAKQERRFQVLDSGANNVIFIKTKNLESDKLVHRILSDLHATKKKKSRVILRMLPVTGTCKAFQEDMLKYLTTFLEPWFKTPNSGTYQIAFKARNSSHNKRDEIIKAVAGLVGKMNPKNKVDLTSPELTIIVEVIKAVCCISVVKDYTLYRKYNVQEVVKEDAPKPDVDTAEQKEEEEVKKSDVDTAEQKEEVKKSDVDTAEQKEEEEVKKSDVDTAEQKEEEEEVKKSDVDTAEQKEEEVKKSDVDTAEQKEEEEVKKSDVDTAEQKEEEEVKKSDVDTAEQKEEVKKPDVDTAEQKEEEEEVKKSDVDTAEEEEEVKKSDEDNKEADEVAEGDGE